MIKYEKRTEEFEAEPFHSKGNLCARFGVFPFYYVKISENQIKQVNDGDWVVRNEAGQIAVVDEATFTKFFKRQDYDDQNI